MKIIVLGLRGFPRVAGGVEAHCENLYPLLAKLGCSVEVVVRSPYVPAETTSWRGVTLTRLWSPRRTGLETLLHTLLGVFYAAWRRPDVLHIHSIGPALFTPLARLLGLRVVLTHHAPDYRQQKWGRVGRWLLKTGERLGLRFADEVISVSRHGAQDLMRLYGREATVVPNGVPAFPARAIDPVLRELGLTPGHYVLHVGRAIPDKRQDDLIRAYGKAPLDGWKLVLVGDTSGKDEYSRRVRELAAADPRVVLAGFRSGGALQSLFTNAGCFALPSAIEGLPIAMLEALGAGCPVVASDIPANHEVELPGCCYVPVGDCDALAAALAAVPTQVSRSEWARLQRSVQTDFDWSAIAARIADIYGMPAMTITEPIDDPVHAARIASRRAALEPVRDTGGALHELAHGQATARAPEAVGAQLEDARERVREVAGG